MVSIVPSSILSSERLQILESLSSDGASANKPNNRLNLTGKFSRYDSWCSEICLGFSPGKLPETLCLRKRDMMSELIIPNPKIMMGKPVIKGTRITV